MIKITQEGQEEKAEKEGIKRWNKQKANSKRTDVNLKISINILNVNILKYPQIRGIDCQIGYKSKTQHLLIKKDTFNIMTLIH